jgi:hypothetical protein
MLNGSITFWRKSYATFNKEKKSPVKIGVVASANTCFMHSQNNTELVIDESGYNAHIYPRWF